MTSSLTTALEEMNEQLRRENDVLKGEIDMVKDENKQLKTNNDIRKDENKQLTTLLNKMAVNNHNQIQQINSQSSEIATMKDENKQLKTENDMIKVENIQLKLENDDLKARHVRSLHSPLVPQRRQQLKVSQWSGIT